ncbi:MAG: hydrogenase maturation nickel metallochaperone HypA [Thermodesulfobacteriota bacterium]
MHEMGIALEILKIVTASIPQDMNNATVSTVKLKVGKLSAVVPESLRFCFEIAAQDTPVAKARLEIEEIPVMIKCKTCNALWEINEPAFGCKACGRGSIEVISGRELDIESIEVEDSAG